MTNDINPDLAALLYEANPLATRLLHGDLRAAEPLAEVERRLADLAASLGLPRKKGPTPR